MKKIHLNIILILILFQFSLSSSIAQDYIHWQLPPGAIARLGKGKLFEIKYIPNSKLIAVSTSIGVWLYDTDTGIELSLIAGHTDSIECIAISSDGKLLATGSNDKGIKIWDIETRTRKATLVKHIDDVRSVAFSPNGKTLASTSEDATVCHLGYPDCQADKNTYRTHTSGGEQSHLVKMWPFLVQVLITMSHIFIPLSNAATVELLIILSGHQRAVT